MKPLTIKADPLCPARRAFLMPDVTDPRVDPLDAFDGGIEAAERLLILCHPDDEQRIRDAVAVEQERPKWWRDWQRIEQAFVAAREEDR